MRTLLSLVCASAFALGGCELIASVDHDLINPGGGGQGVGGDPTTGGNGAGGSTGGEGGGTGGGEPECSVPEDCPTAATCQVATCEGETCGVENLDATNTCEIKAPDDGVCSEGACVECVDNTQCKDPETCDTENNVCVAPHCLNGTTDEDETDLNCGGADCAPCANDLACVGADDCTSGFCDNLVCASCDGDDANCAANEFCNASGVCVADLADGATCESAGQCGSGFCADDGSGTASVCCTTECDGDCRACSGNGGTCVNAAATDTCGDPATCNGDDLKPQDMCDGAGTCVAGTAAVCADNFTCDSSAMPDACFSGTCGDQIECGTGAYCALTGSTEADDACHDKKIVAVACVEDYECATNNCAGNLCTLL